VWLRIDPRLGDADAASAALAERITLDVRYDTGILGIGGCGGAESDFAGYGEPIASGTLASLDGSALATGVELNPRLLGNGCLTTDERRCLIFAWEFESEGGNAGQGGAVDFDVEFAADDCGAEGNPFEATDGASGDSSLDADGDPHDSRRRRRGAPERDEPAPPARRRHRRYRRCRDGERARDGAYLSDRETFPNNGFGAGEVELVVNDTVSDGTFAVDVSEINRGHDGTERFDIEVRTNPVRVWLATDCPDASDALANVLEIKVIVDGESLTGDYRSLADVERDLVAGERLVEAVSTPMTG